MFSHYTVCGCCCFPLNSWNYFTSGKSSITYWFTVNHLLNIPGMVKEEKEIYEQTLQFVNLFGNWKFQNFHWIFYKNKIKYEGATFQIHHHNAEKIASKELFCYVWYLLMFTNISFNFQSWKHANTNIKYAVLCRLTTHQFLYCHVYTHWCLWVAKSGNGT